MSQSKEFQNFDQTMQKLMSVSHSEIKAELEAEKAAKKSRKKPKGGWPPSPAPKITPDCFKC